MRCLTTTAIPSEGRDLFDELSPGDRVEVDHLVTVGLDSWMTKTFPLGIFKDKEAASANKTE